MSLRKCFLSLLIIFSHLLALVALKMQVRRLGYSVLHNSVEHRKLSDEYNFKFLTYTRLTNLSRLDRLAKKNKLRGVKKGQVIQITGPNLALPH